MDLNLPSHVLNQTKHMTDTIFTQELQVYGVSLHRAILDSLIGDIEAAIADGRIRSQDGKHSVYDFLKVFAGTKNPSKTWKDFVEAEPDTLTFCYSVDFIRSDGKKANIESIAAEIVGLIYIAYMGHGKFSHKLRASSASMIAAEYRSRNQRPCEAESLKSPEVEALERALAQSQEKEKQSKEAHNKFPISIDELKATTQIVNKSQIKAAIVRDLILDEEYCELDGKIYLTLPIYHILCMSFRSMAGTDISRLPEILKVQTELYFRLQENRRANVRMGKRDKYNSPGQIPIAL